MSAMGNERVDVMLGRKRKPGSRRRLRSRYDHILELQADRGLRHERIG